MENYSNTILKSLDIAKRIALKVEQAGGKVYYVGGCVRDSILGIESKDYDIEVHGVSVTTLENILDEIGNRINIGQSFGIYKLTGYELDIALPRKESVRGKGHKDFDIFVDPFIGTYKAAKRRDFTINALMKDVTTGQIIDHFNGINDLKNHIIRHINDETFIEDPLRVLRAAQFAARFGFTVALETIELCKTMDLTTLSKERVFSELEKGLLKSIKPSIFFEILDKMNQLDYWFKELKQLQNVPQNPKYHQEGNVYIHTMMVIDQGKNYCFQSLNPYAFMLSCLVHDYGKILATNIIDGEIHSYNHEILGVDIAKEFLTRITNNREITAYVLNSVRYHMMPTSYAKQKSRIKKTNKMFDLVIDKVGIILLSISDNECKISEKIEELDVNFLYDRLKIYQETMAKPYVTGKDLVALGFKGSPLLSKGLEYAHDLRLAQVEKESALKQTIAYINKLSKNEGDK